MKRIYTEQQRIEHARNCLEWMAAGKSMKSYALGQGIIPRTLQNWITKYRKKSPRRQGQNTDASLVRIESQTECPRVQQVQTCSLNVSFGSLVIELPAGNSDADLKRVLVTVKEVL
jgi:transposase-like protein